MLKNKCFYTYTQGEGPHKCSTLQDSEKSFSKVVTPYLNPSIIVWFPILNRPWYFGISLHPCSNTSLPCGAWMVATISGRLGWLLACTCLLFHPKLWLMLWLLSPVVVGSGVPRSYPEELDNTTNMRRELMFQGAIFDHCETEHGKGPAEKIFFLLNPKNCSRIHCF